MKSLSNLSPQTIQTLSNEQLLALALLKQRGELSDAASKGNHRFVSYHDDPNGFARDILGISPWEKQEQILCALASETRVSVRGRE